MKVATSWKKGNLTFLFFLQCSHVKCGVVILVYSGFIWFSIAACSQHTMLRFNLPLKTHCLPQPPWGTNANVVFHHFHLCLEGTSCSNSDNQASQDAWAYHITEVGAAALDWLKNGPTLALQITTLPAKWTPSRDGAVTQLLELGAPNKSEFLAWSFWGPTPVISVSKVLGFWILQAHWSSKIMKTQDDWFINMPVSSSSRNCPNLSFLDVGHCRDLRVFCMFCFRMLEEYDVDTGWPRTKYAQFVHLWNHNKTQYTQTTNIQIH